MIANQVKTVFLLGALTGLLLVIGSLFGQYGLTIAIILAVVINFSAYWFSDKIVLKIYRAKEIKEGRLYNIVKKISSKANIPMPKVCIVPLPVANAFAVGRNYEHAAVAATKGILDLLNDEELEGVIAHEISHIKNKDTLIQAVAATIAGIIAYVAMMARFAAIFGGYRDRNSGSMLELLVLAILTPILASLIQLAISRSREFIADESGAKILKKSSGLARALEKISKSVKRMPLRPMSTTETTAHIFICSPFSGRGLVNMFSTHPAVEKRVKRLNSMKF